MLKSKRLFSAALSVFLILGTLNAIPAYADTYIVTSRLAGNDRYATSIAISSSGWEKASTVIITTGSDYPDALSASSLSKLKDAPILLTQKNALSQAAINEIERLNASQAIIVGGTGVISTAVQGQLKSLNVSYTRLSGDNRYATSEKVAEQVGTDNGIIVATGLNFPDALSVAPIAGIKSIPILLSPKNSLDSNVSSFIKGKDIPVSYIIGGTGVLSNSIYSSVPHGSRLSGSDRYATNLEINRNFSSDLNFDTVYLATGNDFPDALSGSALAAKNGAPIFLTDKNSISSATLSFMREKNVKHVVILGQTGVVSTNVQNIVESYLNNQKGYVNNPELDIDLKVRQTPDINGSIEGVLYNYENVQVLDTATDTSGSLWYKINYHNSYGYVSGQYVQLYTSPPDSVVQIASNITKQFEVGSSGQVAGNSDGEGLSLGYLQWCIGQGTLQPLLNRMDREYNDTMESLFGTNYTALHNMTLDTLPSQLSWAASINNSSKRIIEPWNSEFSKLCSNQYFIDVENDAKVLTVRKAMLICDKYNLKTVRGFALAFDIANQIGSINSSAANAIDAAIRQNPSMSERDLLKVIANDTANSLTSNAADVRSRELAIVNGEGTVHGTVLYLDKNYGLSDSCWR